MAISPPSDILLDVAAAADPTKVRAATERLAKLAADPTVANDGFSKALTAASRPGFDAGAASTATGPAAIDSANDWRSPMRTQAQTKSSVYQKFEALMLQNFVQNMLPSDDDLYGDKASSGAYRSMMAEQLANEIAKAGGIGVAQAVERAHPAMPAPPRVNSG